MTIEKGVEVMTDKRIEKAMAEDLMAQYGAMVSVTDISKYTGFGRQKVMALVRGCREFGAGTGRRYFYAEVAEAVMKGGGLK